MTGGAAHVGKRGRDRGEPLLDVLPGLHQVGAAIEDQLDRRELDHRLRAHLVEAREAGEHLLEGDRDERLDLGRPTARTTSSAPRPEAGANSGNTSTGMPLQLAESEDHHRHAERDDDEAELKALGDDPPHHHVESPTSRCRVSAPKSSATPTTTTGVPTAGPAGQIRRVALDAVDLELLPDEHVVPVTT